MSAEKDRPPENDLEVENQDRIWEFFQNEGKESFQSGRSRQLFLLRRVGKPGRVLNIGVGSGSFEQLALDAGVEVYSLDPSERSIIRLREHLHLADRAQIGYSQSMPFQDNYFQAVVISEVLEHLSPEVLVASLVEIRRVLAPGGLLIGTVPARENLLSNIIVCPDCGKRFHRWGHLQSFDKSRMRSLLEREFENVRVEERPIGGAAGLNWKGRIEQALIFLLWRAGVHGSRENVVFEARCPAAPREASRV